MICYPKLKVMKPLILTILLSFLTVNILGFSSLAHENHSMHHTCLFSFSSACAQVVDPVSSTLEHLANLQNSIQATPGQPIVATTLLIFSLIVVALVLDKEKLKAAQYFRIFKIQFFEQLFKFLTQFLAWLSILNKHDSLALERAR